jgi:hypothetical protein
MAALEERFWAKVEKTDGCWLWTASKVHNGYGNFYIGRDGERVIFAYAHRVAYELLVGPIPNGLQLDHLCQVRHCVNPEHLEPVTQQENIRREMAWFGERTHCKYGHPFSRENTAYWKGRGRACRKCHRDRERYRKRRVVSEQRRLRAQGLRQSAR